MYSDTAQAPIPVPSTLLPSGAVWGHWNTCHLQTGPQPGDTDPTASPRASSRAPEPQLCEAEPGTFSALVACPPCQPSVGPDHPKQPLSPLPAHLPVFLDVSCRCLCLTMNYLTDRSAELWLGGSCGGHWGEDRQVPWGRGRCGREERSILSCPIASHPIWRLKVKGRLTSVGAALQSPAATTHQL